MKLKPKRITNYIYLFLLLALSGNPFFSIGEDHAQYIFAVFVLLIALKHYIYFNTNKSKLFFRYILIFSGIFFLQGIVLGFVSISGAIGFLLKITLGFIIIVRLGATFKNNYFNVLFVLSAISIVGYLYNLLLGDIPALYYRENTNIYSDNSLRSVIIFNQLADGFRNSGMFWEPGAFACYINLTFLFYLGRLRALLKTNKFKVLIILIALITTYSTTGYFVFFLIIITTIFTEFSRKYKFITIPIAALFVIGGFMLYQNLEFLNDKINRQYEITKSLEGDFSNTRFGSLVFDWHYIKKHPLVGNGIHSSTRYADHPWLQEGALGHGNGFSNFLASMGVISLFLYSFFILKYNTNHPWIFLIAIFALMQGEQLMNYPLFLSLPFIFIYEKYYRSPAYLSQS